MKRWIFVCLIALLLLSACGTAPVSLQEQTDSPMDLTQPDLTQSKPAGKQTSQSPNLSPPETGLLYSNLAGKTSRQQVRQILEQAGIQKDALDIFFSWVEDFCQTMEDCIAYTLQDDFVQIQEPVVDYGDYSDMSRCWYKTHNRRYSDILCRIAAFQLIKQYLTIGEPLESDQWELGEDQWLYSDYDAIANFPIVAFSSEETAAYFTLYNPISIPSNLPQEEMFQAVQTSWKDRGVSFAQGPVSLMTIWTQSNDRMAAAHAAVLIEWKDCLLLVEKTNPQSPYQASVFSTPEQVGDYLYQSIYQDNLKYSLPTGSCVVLQNDGLLAQYDSAPLP